MINRIVQLNVKLYYITIYKQKIQKNQMHIDF